MKHKIRWITETALLLALLVTLQALTKGFGQLVTGSCVNAILVISLLLCGLSSGLTVALISPVMAFVLGIAPNFITVLPIMIANCCYVLLFHGVLFRDNALWKQGLALAGASAVKFCVLYVLVVKLICGAASGALLGKKLGSMVVLAPPMLKALPTMFAWPQLFTALIGGTLALLIAPALKKALHR